MKRIGIIPSPNSLSIAAALVEDSRLRAVAVEAEEEATRPRNYDLQGPKPKAGPPTSQESDMPSRQQRRWKERQQAKIRKR